MGTFEEEEIALLVEYSTPLEPIPPDIPEFLRSLRNVPLPRPPRAILFDIYGTLVISASGEIGSAADVTREGAFLDAYRIASGSALPDEAGRIMAFAYSEAIERVHAQGRVAGLPHPEVNILSVWRIVLNELGATHLDAAPVDVEQLAIAFETQVNPVWPMPGSRELLRRLAHEELPLGIVSNAQFYTPMLFPSLFGASLTELGFERELSAFSWEHERAKPDAALFAGPLASLQARGIDSRDVVYVGNDMRNDVWCARQVGCMTILFPGDQRSLRMRQDDPELAGFTPDSMVSSLAELPGVLRIE
ncbi:MAG: HAD family hydrolase [Spirochaetota bacterium]